MTGCGDEAPAWAYASALAGLPFMTWDRLGALLAAGDAESAWRRVRGGRAGAAWARAAATVDVAGVAAAHRRAGVDVFMASDDRYPEVLRGDAQAPPVLFCQGELAALARPRVAIVGTRRCTGYGRDVARQLGAELAGAGVCVVSGLAAGIDGAAHEGALEASGVPGSAAAAPAGVVGSGLDVVYPRRHAVLWRRVATGGLLISEAPLGTRPEPWRFPARNRVIAAVACVLVVVESHRAGGSMHTVAAAAERGVPVMAVPGPVRSSASSGTNRLLADGCPPVCDVDDVLAALALETAGPASRPERRPAPHGDEALVLDALGWSPATVDDVSSRTSMAPSRVALALAHLEESGWARRAGGWWERAGSR